MRTSCEETEFVYDLELTLVCFDVSGTGDETPASGHVERTNED